MRKFFFIILFLAVSGVAFAQIEKEPVEKTSDYWVYVRLEDRSGVTAADDTANTQKPIIESKKTYFVYFDRTSPEVRAKEGQGEKGEIIAIIDASTINPPDWDYQNFYLVKMELTDSEVKQMFFKDEMAKIDIKTLPTDTKVMTYAVKDISFKQLSTAVAVEQ